MPGTCGGQKTVANLSEAELQTVVRYHVGAGIQPESSGNAANTLNHGAIFPAPMIISFDTFTYTS